MLRSISAHVQRDMPHALARTGLVLPDGRSRKPDHDRGNRILDDAYRPIVRAVAQRYDPLMAEVESIPVVDDLRAQQLVAGWREGVWRNAESLASTADTGAEDVNHELVERNAHTRAETMRTGEVPGHREVRDAHCAAMLAAQDDTDPDDPVAYPPAPAEDDQVEPGGTDRGRALPATGGGVGALALLACSGSG